MQNFLVKALVTSIEDAATPTLTQSPSNLPNEIVLTLAEGVSMKLVRVPAGEFLMGSDPVSDTFTKANERPQHRVYVSDFYIGKYEVTGGAICRVCAGYRL